MSWALPYVLRLVSGETVKFRPRGNSMSGKIESGQLVTVRPIADNDLITPGTIVLCRVGNKHYLHIVKAVRATHHERFLIGNNRGYDNGWISMKNIFGVCTAVEP